MSYFDGYGELLSSILLFILLIAGAAAAHVALPKLPARHRSQETLDTVRLISSFGVTFAALVLGLLTASANTAFMTTGNDINALAGNIRQTTNCLESYGPETTQIRALLKTYTAGAIFATWPEESAPPGDYPKDSRVGQKLESLSLGEILQKARLAIVKLIKADPEREELARICSEDFQNLTNNRWKLIGEAHSSISVPFYRVLVLMLLMIFVSFGLSAPRNALAQLSIVVAALSIAVSIFVVLELDGPLDGLVKVSSVALRETLTHFDE